MPSAKAADGTSQPVWCQYTNTWEAQIGDAGSNNNKNRSPLTEIPNNADESITQPGGQGAQVYAPNSSSDTLKESLNLYCKDQYAMFDASVTTTCDSYKTPNATEGSITVSIANNGKKKNKPMEYTITIGNTVIDIVTINGGNNLTMPYAYDQGEYSVTIADADNSKLEFTAVVGACELETATVAMEYTDDCNDLGEVNAPKWTTELASNSPAYSYVKNDDGSYTVTARPGYLLDITVNGMQEATNSNSYVFKLPLDSGVICYQTVPVPPVPAITYICGPVGTAEWQVPADTDNISWKLVDGELVAYAADDWAFENEDGSNVAFKNYGYASQYATYKACPAPVAPMFDDMTCELNDTVGYTIPADEHNTYTIQHGSGEEDEVDAGKHSLLRINQTITIRAYDINDELSGEWTHTFTIPDCKIGIGGIKPIPAPVKPAVAVQELPQTGPSDDNSYMTLLGLAASAATYGAVLLLQRRNA